MPALTTNPTLPSYVRREAREVAEDLLLVHRLLGGTRVMHAHATEYIRKWRDEHPETYALRRTCEPVFGGLERTLSAGVGMLFAKPPAITWNGAQAAMQADWNSIDAAGTKWTVFAKRFADVALRDGLALLLVDHPGPPVDTNGQPVRVTAEIEQRFALRPRWAMFGRDALINWRVASVENEQRLTLLVLAESATIDDGPFGVAHVDRYRVLRLLPVEQGGWAATWELFERRPDDDVSDAASYRAVGAGVFRNRAGEIASRLPVAIAYAGRTDAPCTASVPLLGVAQANLGHWRLASDLTFNRQVCGFEQLVIAGDLVQTDLGQAPRLKIGPLVGVHVTQGSSVTWESPKGGGLAQLERGKREKLEEMAQLGLSFLQTDTRAAETAEAKRLDATAENATLASAAQGIEDALNLAAELDAWYRGIPQAEAPVLEISRDYERTGMPPALLQAWVRAIVDAGLPVRLLLAQMQQGGLIAPDQDLEDLEAEIMANQAAIADAAAERRALDGARDDDDA
jgi:hypothetical protein